jgi:hypothetical protein
MTFCPLHIESTHEHGGARTDLKQKKSINPVRSNKMPNRNLALETVTRVSEFFRLNLILSDKNGPERGSKPDPDFGHLLSSH